MIMNVAQSYTIDEWMIEWLKKGMCMCIGYYNDDIMMI